MLSAWLCCLEPSLVACPIMMLSPLPLPRRYLVHHDPMEVAHHFTDVLVIGGGVAGLRSVMGVPPNYRITVITKQEVKESNSAYAQGGIAGVLDPEDTFEDHIADTHSAGKGLCDPEVVELVVRDAPARINELIQWGTQFDRVNGSVALTREGGHSHARIVHAMGDATGWEMMRAMIKRVQGLEHVRVWQNSFTLDLLTREGRCRGALVWDSKRGLSCIWARATILATGGAGQLFRETTNSAVATADGHAMAYRAGAVLRDMEFMQFHPTVLYIAGSSRHLLTEALRGEGAYLRDRDGRRFMPEFHPLAELAPRDDVSRAITAQMKKTQHPCVYLDLSHLNAEFVRGRFPGIARVCAGFDLDVTRDPIPVRPAAHYMIGGVAVDTYGRTSVPGLWAAGESTSTGLHGANRLASNSLLEGLVYGARAADDVVEHIEHGLASPLEVLWNSDEVGNGESSRSTLDLQDIRESLRALMWRSVGILRDAQGLAEAGEAVEFWCRYVLDHEFDDPAGWTLQNMLITARLMIASAATREESRGVHTRVDFPSTNPAWAHSIELRRPESRAQTQRVFPEVV